jgi:macrolide transport system ATP-binding/permease protein
MRFLFSRKRQSELSEEIQSHLEMAARDRVERGEGAGEAMAAARREFGNAAVVREVAHDQWGWAWLENLFQDVHFGLRMLRKSPAFTAVAVLTLALGIGANTAIFSLINAVMLRNLPVENPQQLVLFQWESDKWPPHFSMTGWKSGFAFSYEEFKEFSAQKNVMSSIFAFVPLGFNDQDTTVGINGEPTLADGVMVTGQYFSGLGVTPLLGRGINEADENPSAPRAVVISYAYWTRRFAQDRSIIGKDVTLNGMPFTIIGVTPRNFYGISVGTEPDLWVPFDDKPNMRPWSASPGGTDSVFTERDWLCLNLMGRLKDGVTTEQAQGALDAIFHQFVTSNWHPPKESDVPHLILASGRQGLPVLQNNSAQPMYMLMVAVGLLLLIACANVATLLLARANSRRKEISVRLAIGASRSRLIRQLLTESVLMATLGGALGLAFANWGTRALIALMSKANNGTMILDAGTDSHVLCFAFGVAVLTGILFGLVPALRASNADLLSTMKDNTAAVWDSHSKHRLGESLIIAQVAASVVLMIGAGLFVRTLANFESHNFGFDQRNLLTFGLDPTRAGYHEARLVNLYSQLLDRIQALPGVRAATLIENPPFSGWSNKNSSVSVEGSAEKQGDSELYWQAVGPDFFSTMGIPIVLGRGIQRTDTAASSKVAVIDETFSKKVFPGGNPIGHRFSLSLKYDPANSYEIVGVVRPAELTDVNPGFHPKSYASYAQLPKTLGQMFFEVRAEGPPATIVSELRDAVHQTDASLPLIALKTQAEETSQALSFQRLFAHLTTVFGLFALLLAMIGLYGTMAYSVTRKTHEIGIRMALGAKPAAVLGMVFRQGITLTFIGVATGIVAALGITRLISSMIFGVAPYDPATFLIVAAVLLAIAFLACYIPARRAMKVDPMAALRYE